MSIEAPTRLQARLATARPGDVLDIAGVTPLQLPSLPVVRRWTGGTLVFSDSPEIASSPGILYADTLAAGFVRLMLYHESTSLTDLNLSVVIEPVDASDPPVVTLRRRVQQGPSKDYPGVGRTAALDFVSQPDDPITQTIQEATLLDPLLDQEQGFRSEALMIAQYDFDIAGGDLKFTVLARDPDTESLDVFQTLDFLPREQKSDGTFAHDRGTFPGSADKSISNSASPYSTASGMAHIRLANGRFDPDVPTDADRDPLAGDDGTGFDAVLNFPSIVAGNFGVMYSVDLHWVNPDGRHVAILLNPRAGAFAGAVGVVLDTGEVVGVATPRLSSPAVSDPARATLLGAWDPAQSPEVTLKWTPAGASSLPVEWLLVPFTAPG